MEIIEHIRHEFNDNLNKIDISKMNQLKELFIHHQNNIHISGIGKSEIMSIYFTNLLKSLSYKAFYLNIQNASHGDIGCVDENDMCILFSKSGNTRELLDFIKLIQLKKTKIILISCNPNCNLAQYAYIHYVLPFNNEIKQGISYIPNNSCMTTMIFINIFVKMLEKISINEYKNNHSGGSIGKEIQHYLSDSDELLEANG